jgi:hypothetical protein
MSFTLSVQKLRTVDRLTPAPLLQIFRLVAHLYSRYACDVDDYRAGSKWKQFSLPSLPSFGVQFMKIYVAFWKRRMEINELSPVHVVEGVVTWNFSLLRM